VTKAASEKENDVFAAEYQERQGCKPKSACHTAGQKDFAENRFSGECNFT
jgi:hypothetical protein